jgi:hypothetical protein
MIRFRALGALDLVRSEGPEIRTVLAQPKRVALLAYLAVARPTGFHRRDRLLAMFWPDAEDERARASLSRAIYFLRRELGDDVIVNRGDDEISLNPDRVWCDAAAFESHLDRGQAREALELYRGDLLPGFSLPTPMVSRRGSRKNALACGILRRRAPGGLPTPRSRQGTFRSLRTGRTVLSRLHHFERRE